MCVELADTGHGSLGIRMTNNVQYYAFYHDGAVRSFGIPFSANKRPRLSWRHYGKAVDVGTQSTGNYAN